VNAVLPSPVIDLKSATPQSAVHRVRPIAGDRDRYSIALFVDPDAAVEVECFESCITSDRPRRFPRITAGEHIRQKIAATHGDST
jgi:isopenicillin N synthase-like dioxygenase